MRVNQGQPVSSPNRDLRYRCSSCRYFLGDGVLCAKTLNTTYADRSACLYGSLSPAPGVVPATSGADGDGRAS
jgi:hypothetical protein